VELNARLVFSSNRPFLQATIFDFSTLCFASLLCVYCGVGQPKSAAKERLEPQNKSSFIDCFKALQNSSSPPNIDPNSTKNHLKIPEKLGSNTLKTDEKIHQKPGIFPVALQSLRLHITNIAHVLNLVL
jgi:hypothetical protein